MGFGLVSGKLRRFFVVSRDRSILLSCVPLLGTYLWSFRVLLGLRMSLCGLVKSVFWHRKLFLLALASAKRIGELHALSYRVSHTRNWGEVSFSFVTGFLDRTAPHRPRCERFFVTAGRSKKEISKTTVSFWLRKTISRAYELSGTALPVPAPELVRRVVLLRLFFSRRILLSTRC